VGVIAAGFAPAASKTVKPAKAPGLNNKPIAVPKTMEKSFLCIVASKKIAQKLLSVRNAVSRTTIKKITLDPNANNSS